MGNFTYKNNVLYGEHVDLYKLSLEHQTPFYCYSLDSIKSKYKTFKEVFNFKPTLIAYALKANSNLSILAELAKLGAGADVVSGWEIKKAIDANIPANKIVFSGIGKTYEEVVLGIELEIKQFNIESTSEFELINSVAKSLNKKANIALRIKPDVRAETHHKISTGQKESKFGIDIEQAKHIIFNLSQYPNVIFTGLSCHIGSQITTIEPFKEAFRIITNFAKECISQGIVINSIDFGGGIGIQYSSEKTIDIAAYAKIVQELTQELKIEIILEPGRFIVGNSGILISKVLYKKQTSAQQNFLILDAGMNDFIRPTLYDASHNILPLMKKSDEQEYYDVVGPVCESGDIFGKNILLEKLAAGDYIALMGAGAYGYSMASNYNLRPKPAELLISDSHFAVIRNSQSYKNYSALESMPWWI